MHNLAYSLPTPKTFSLSLYIYIYIHIRRTRHSWRNKDELISNVLQWTSSYWWVIIGWPARTHLQQLCTNTGWSLEDLPKDERGSGKSILMACYDDDIYHHHHVTLPAWISLALSCNSLLLSITPKRSSRLHPVSELLYVGSSWSSCFWSSMWRGPQEYIAYEFVLTSPAVSHMSGLFNLDSFHDGW